VLLQDVPAAVKAFVRANSRRGPVKALTKALGIKQPVKHQFPST
jgi:hypothetical protein